MTSDADRANVEATGNDSETADRDGDEVRVWLVERTYSDDEQNIIILVYATLDGQRYFRKERALTSFSSDVRETTAAVDVTPNNLGTVTDEEERERYATEATRMAESHDPDDAV